MTFIGQKIKQLRTLKGFSREDLAEKLNISVTAYAKIERDETDPNFSRLQQIAEIFDISVQELVSFGEKNVFFIQGNNENSPLGQNIVTYYQQKDLSHENELLKIKLQAMEKEIESLYRELKQLNDIILLLKKV
jgi:transcriptional regulator with XRE-family HTH domain